MVVYLAVSGFCGLFSLVYEYFSHGVYSPWMVFLFAWPLLGGAVPYAVLAWRGNRRVSPITSWARLAHHCAVASLTVGACISGVLDIYGTTSVWTPVYWAAGIVLGTTGLVMGVVGSRPEQAH